MANVTRQICRGELYHQWFPAPRQARAMTARVTVPVAVHTPSRYRFERCRGPPIWCFPAGSLVGLTVSCSRHS
jgi:hypothetical protein